MGGMVISSFQSSCFYVKFLFIVFYIHIVGGERFCVVDLLMLSMHESKYEVDISENGTSILIGTEMHAFYTSSSRLKDEIPLQDDHDTLLTAHQEVVDLVLYNTVPFCTLYPKFVPHNYMCATVQVMYQGYIHEST